MMAKGNKTTVTHPNGQVSTRTSQSRIYTHAVVIRKTRQALVREQLDMAEEFDDRALQARKAINGEITEEVRQWPGARTYTTLYMNGEYAAGYTSDNPRPTYEEMNDRMRVRVAQNEARASEYRAKAAEIDNGPDEEYGVLRWSSRADLAHKAATGEFAILLRDGVTITVVPVD